MADERIRLEIGFEGGQVMGVQVTPEDADAFSGSSVPAATEPWSSASRTAAASWFSHTFSTSSATPERPGRLRRFAPRGRWPRGRHRRAAERRQDDPVQRADARRSRDHRVRDGFRQAEPGHGADRGRAARASCSRRRRAQGDSRRHPGGGRARHGSRAARQSAPGRRAARRSSTATPRSRPGSAISKRSGSSCSSRIATMSSGGSSGSRSRRSRAIRGSGPRSHELERLLAYVDGRGAAHRVRRRPAGRARAADDKAADRDHEWAGRASTPSSRPSWPELDPAGGRCLPGGEASALDEVVSRLFGALDLISFFTASEQETRAWTLRRGGTALAAAETIHTDIARGFIRCEVIRGSDLVESGSRSRGAAARPAAAGGEEPTPVEDGDVLNIRFNV